MMVLALDTATTTGFATGLTGTAPTWGSINFAHADGNGAVLARYRRWLEQRCYSLKPGLIVFEAPFIPHAGQKTAMNATTLFRLVGFVDFTEAIAWELGIECRQATSSEIAKFFIGKGRIEGGREAKKAATVDMCLAYGCDVGDSDDAADALALWFKAEATIDREAAARRRSAASAAIEEIRMRSAAGVASPAALVKPTRRGASSNGPRQHQFTTF